MHCPSIIAVYELFQSNQSFVALTDSTMMIKFWLCNCSLKHTLLTKKYEMTFFSLQVGVKTDGSADNITVSCFVYSKVLLRYSTYLSNVFEDL